MQISPIGVDLAKHVFQLHGVGPDGCSCPAQKVRGAQLQSFFANLPRCMIGMEACATAHHWARELRDIGHEVRLLPAHYVKAYVKRGKNNAADAEAICEAISPIIHFVAIKTKEQQAALVMHRARDLLVRQRTQLVNALRGPLAEFGISEPQGIRHVERLRAYLDEDVVPQIGRRTQVAHQAAQRARETDHAIEAKARAWHGQTQLTNG
jgi:transposase